MLGEPLFLTLFRVFCSTCIGKVLFANYVGRANPFSVRCCICGNIGSSNVGSSICGTLFLEALLLCTQAERRGNVVALSLLLNSLLPCLLYRLCSEK